MIITDGTTTLTLKDPAIGYNRSSDSGIIIKTNLAGVTILSTTTSRTQDIRLLKLTLRSDIANNLYAFAIANIGKPVSFTIGMEEFTALISSDELELSTVRPDPCGIKTCSLRLRVLTTTGYVGASTEACFLGIRDENGFNILDHNGRVIYDS